MITDLTFNDFCNRYYLEARRAADVSVANFIKEHGQPNSSIDLDLVKDAAITDSLRKVYDRFDSDNKNKASIETFLSVVVNNQVLTGLRNESTAVGAAKRDLGVGASDGQEKSVRNVDEPNDEKISMRQKVNECINMLDPIDRTIIECCMENSRNYSGKALSKLGWGEERRDEVKERRAKAYAQLQEMLKEYDTRHKKESEIRPDTESLKKPEKVVYEHNIPLKAINNYAPYIRECFGIFHPTLEPELALLKHDPERTFKLYELVPFEEIETAFDEGNFACDKNTRMICLQLLWFVANLYCHDQFERYQDYFTYEVEYDDLRWKSVRGDILRFYAFMQDFKEEIPITIKIGKKKVVINDYDRWFQALMDNHLFPKCLPGIQSKEHALELLKKSPGRKVENELAVAIINGIAKLFSEEGLISGRAPVNLCRFIRQYLILMEILDVNDGVISEVSIKSTINYAAHKNSDTRLPSAELEDASIEDIHLSGFSPEERWLYNKEE